MHIPQELVDLIMNNLHDDVPSLKSCTLTARTFVSSAQTWLFNKIEILPPRSLEGSDSESSCQRFYKLLTSSPHLAPLVHELHIVLAGFETSFAYDEDENGDDIQARHVPWISMSEVPLALVLPLLSIKRISLLENSSRWNSVGGDFSMDWNNHLERSLKSALAAVFSSPTIESVHLRGIVVHSPAQLLSLFSEATSLKELSLSRVYFTQRDPWPESQPWHPQLQSLLVSDIPSHPLCRYLLHPRIDLTHVTSVTIATEEEEWREKMVQAIASSATRLHLYCPRFRTVTNFFTPTLSSVHFFTKDMAAFMFAVFAECPQSSLLEKMVFEGPNTLLPVRLRDTIESGVVHLSALKTIELRAYLREYSDQSFDQWAAEVQSFLPSLVGRGLLTVTQIERGFDSPHHGWE
ncbi:hypothetical protein DFH08DRAFT_1071810 [Mycena albidolilacea]|uniref:Uncharacterized protein n=1 Tax=Mycena albidolilacea TaxID=1033008 RepID=A0AAD7ARK7_9AGAR|nr:hypothetical protein DFH08DRAFT_1071810 [Mycena albidolilacea]